MFGVKHECLGMIWCTMVRSTECWGHIIKNIFYKIYHQHNGQFCSIIFICYLVYKNVVKKQHQMPNKPDNDMAINVCARLVIYMTLDIGKGNLVCCLILSLGLSKFFWLHVGVLFASNGIFLFLASVLTFYVYVDVFTS